MVTLQGAPHHPVDGVLDPIVVNRDDTIQWTRCIVLLSDMVVAFCAVLVAFSHLQFSQIRGRQPYSNVRKIHYVIRPTRRSPAG
jgi:hypothetical protein